MKTMIALLIFILSGSSLMAQNKANLKLNLEKNTRYCFKSESEQTISQTINGMQQNTNAHSSSFLTLKMVDQSAQFIVTEIHFDTLLTKTNAMGVNSKFSSAVEGNIKSSDMSEVMSCILNRLSKNAIYAKMDFSGKVIEIVNSKMLSQILLKDTGEITGQTAAVTKMQIKNTVSDKALISMIETFTHFLPVKQVSPGDKWTNDETISAGGMSMDVMTAYTLNELKDKSAGITSESNIKAAENAEPMEFGGAKITYGDITGLSKSDMVINPLTGLLIKSKGKSQVSGNLNVSVQGMNMQIPMDISAESEIVAVP